MSDFDSSDQNRFTASLLRASAPGFASAATRSLLAGESSSGGGAAISGGADGFSQWRGVLETHLSHLAAAVAAKRPAIFEDHVRWSKWGCLARKVSAEELRASLSALKETLAEELPAPSAAITTSVIDAGVASIENVPDEPPSALSLESGQGEYAARYLMALLEGDRDGALGIVDDARKAGLPVTDIYSQVFVPALAEVGRLWLMGEVHVAEEHFATATTSLAISRLYPDLPRAESCGKTIVTVSIEGELHELGIRIVSDYFTMDGWRVVHLGSSVPGEDLRRGLVDFSADLLAISASLATHLGRVEGMIRELRADPRTADIPVLVGGRAFAAADDYWRELGANAQARSAEHAVEVGRELLGLAPRS